ncbi:protein kinase [Actinoplanes missouriensis]|uniref:protein kinase domain-containing protein n=1 Tax=Actinoplanes missouriensis TaxID=1866 RepID=UPI0033F44132
MADEEPLGREYLLHEEIGRGAVAVVRRATSRAGGPPLAAKLLRPEYASDPRVRELFLREQAALRDLDHPNIVGLRDLVVEGGTLALIMDFVDGPNLRRYLEFRGGRLPVAEVAAIAGQAAAALAAAHAHGVVHLDLKPENILVVPGAGPPQTRITDFGVAVLLHDAERGAPGGTPGYTAPEVFGGAPPTAAADVWSLGVLIAELATGNPAMDPAMLPPALAPVARDCLAADPRRRPPSRRVAAYLRTLAASGERPAPAPTDQRAPADRPKPAPAVSEASAAGADPVSAPTAGTTGPWAAGPSAAPPGTTAPAIAAPFAASAASGEQPPSSTAPSPTPFSAVPRPGLNDTRLRPGVTPPAPPPEAPPPAEPPSRWRRGPLITLGVAALVAATLVGINAAAAGEQDPPQGKGTSVPTQASPASAEPSSPPSSPPPSEDPVANLRVTLAGRVEDGAGTLAIAIRDGTAIAYICDGNRVESWLQGTAKSGQLSLKGKDGSRIAGTFDANSAEGDVTVAGDTHAFTVKKVKKPSGLYRTAARVRGAQVEGSWIVLADGTQVGVLSREGVPAPAPPLDVSGGTVTIDGSTLGTTAIDADSGEGF